MSATAFQRMRREAEAKAKASQQQEEQVEPGEDGIDFNAMSVEELTQYANEHGIDIGNASSQKGILNKIKEAE